MYLATRTRPAAPVDAPSTPTADPGGEPCVGAEGDTPTTPTSRRAVVALGVTSMFTDISSEMVVAVIPLYLVTRVGFDVGGYGTFDGFLAAAGVVLLLVGGVLTDRRRRPKAVAMGGYGISAASRAGLAFTAAPVAWLLLDRVGKGLRVAPRDALISLHADRSDLAASFALHRRLDTFGAMLGPLLAFAALWLVPGDFELVFTLSLLAALAGLVVLAVAVPGGSPPRLDEETEPATPLPTLLTRTPIGRLTASAALLGLGTASDGLLYLALWRLSGIDDTTFPLLFAGTSITYLVAAGPVGRFADRVGRARLLVPGHLVLAAVFVFLAFEASSGVALGTWGVLVCLVLHGLYYAMTDGILPAAASAITEPADRGRGIGLVQTGSALGRLGAGVVFGMAWLHIGLQTALVVVLALLLVAAAVSRVLLAPVIAEDRR